MILVLECSLEFKSLSRLYNKNLNIEFTLGFSNFNVLLLFGQNIIRLEVLKFYIFKIIFFGKSKLQFFLYLYISLKLGTLSFVIIQ